MPIGTLPMHHPPTSDALKASEDPLVFTSVCIFRKLYERPPSLSGMTH